MFAFLPVPALSSNPSLLTHAKFLCDIDAWEQFQASVGHYTWLNQHEVILHTTHAYDQAPTLTSFHIQTRSYSTIGLKLMTGELKRSLTLPTPSPDGKYLLWEDYRKQSHQFVVTNLDGKRLGQWPMHAYRQTISNEEEESVVTWSPDSASLIECVSRWESDGHIDIWQHKVTDLGKEVAFPHLPKTFDFAIWCKAGMNANGRITWPFYYPSPSPELSVICDWNPYSPSEMVRKSVKWPKGEAAVMAELSPDGRHILWQIESSDGLADELVVTNADGSSHKSLGRIRFQSNGNNTRQSFGEVHWNPNSKAVSFVWLKKLYLVDLR